MIKNLKQLLNKKSNGLDYCGPWKNDRIVWTNGCFDLLHAGHTNSLEQAKKLGDKLVVGVNSDDSVARLKGPTRPFRNWYERARLLECLRCVDLVYIFDDDSPIEIIRQFQPDVVVKGDDYLGRDLPEIEVVKSYGGVMCFIPNQKEYSTTATAEKIYQTLKKEKGDYND